MLFGLTEALFRLTEALFRLTGVPFRHFAISCFKHAPANALKPNGTKPRRFRLSHGSCFASVVSLPVFYGPTFLSIERRGKASN